MRKDIFCGCLIIFVLAFILSSFYCQIGFDYLVNKFYFNQHPHTCFESMMFELETVSTCVFGKTLGYKIIRIIEGLIILIIIPMAILITAIQESILLQGLTILLLMVIAISVVQKLFFKDYHNP